MGTTMRPPGYALDIFKTMAGCTDEKEIQKVAAKILECDDFRVAYHWIVDLDEQRAINYYHDMLKMHINSDQVDGKVDRSKHILNLLELYNNTSLISCRLTLSWDYIRSLVIDHFRDNPQDIADFLNYFDGLRNKPKLNNFNINKFLSNFSEDVQVGVLL